MSKKLSTSIIKKSQSFKSIDLEKYGIPYEGISFETGNKDDQIITMRAETFDHFIEITLSISIKLAFLMIIFRKIVVTHKPFIIRTFKQLAEELKTESRVLRKYIKSFEQEGLIFFKKLDKEDSNLSDQYIFSMGPKWKKWIWGSTFFEMIKIKHNVDNFRLGIPKGSMVDPLGVHHGPFGENWGSATDPLGVHGGPPVKSQLTETIGERSEKSDAVFSLSSPQPSISSSSPEAEARDTKETNVSQGEGNQKPNDKNFEYASPDVIEQTMKEIKKNLAVKG